MAEHFGPLTGGKLFSRIHRAKTLADLERELQDIEDEVVAQINEDLAIAREETIAKLYRLTGTWDIAKAQQILAELERQQQQYSVVWTDLMKDALDEALYAGSEIPDIYAKQYGIDISVKPFISRTFLEVSQLTLPDLISGVGNESIAAIGRILRQSVLAQKTPLDAIREIGEMPPFGRFDPKTGHWRGLTDKELRKAMEANGPFAKQFRRLESIVRTEVGRITQTANYLTLRELAQTDPRWQKEWSAVRDSRTRPDHARADGQRQPVDQPFSVGGADMQYPHDPRGPAAETINCRCVLLPWHPSFEGTGTA